MISIRIEDNTDSCLEELDRRIRVLLGAVADELVQVYKSSSDGLGAVQSFATEDGPPHSKPGEIPHHYNGPAYGGYTAVAAGSTKNNAPGTGFAVDQQDFLYEFIDSFVSEPGTPPEAGVGFNLQQSSSGAPAHVVNRQKNYLIQWDRGAVLPSKRQPSADETLDRRTGQIRKKRRAGRPRKISAPQGVRPWVRPLYDGGVSQLRGAAIAAIESIQSGGGGGFDRF